MARVRYGPRTAAELRAAREAAARIPDIWSTSLFAVWETDPDAAAQVLPPPLKPAPRPLVRATVSRVDLPGGGPPLGAGSVAVRAVHGDLEGDYPLVMPMTTERALIGGREVFGEPKKLGEVTLERDGDRVRAALARHGVAFVQVNGVVGEALPVADHEALDFYLKFLPAPDGRGLDGDAALVHCTRRGRARALNRVDGTVILADSPYDPVADLPVLGPVEITLSERTSVQEGRIAARVPAADVLPYVHQRYDDPLQVLDA
ncbi:acetoacetate decarboxylase family protein [Actinomadura fibrosa]|uniref:Acetoacetate decarboxylase family protein n=1 Tax=Actinomadura fibrosa TaxID=111802 RepID=A0ABW2XWY3_9ACTN|nr:acetoacetate decarboxylase family protein [Actinomadura fibrosa]